MHERGGVPQLDIYQKLYPQSYKNEWKINGNRVLVSTQISQFWDTATRRTSRSQSTHSQEACEWFGDDLQVLLVKLKQILHWKVGCSDFGAIPMIQAPLSLLSPRAGVSFHVGFLHIPSFLPCHYNS